ncbi:MAG: hypothetical protein WBX18_20870 [Terracidiphilus sp.]
MFSKQGHTAAGAAGLCVRAGAALLVLCLSLAAAGCATTQLAKHATALSTATAPVVDQATEAYRDAETIHELRTDYDAEKQFDQTTPAYNPADTEVLLTDQAIQARLALLEAFQLYVKQLVAITGGTDSPALDAASMSLGANLSSLTNALAPTVESAVGITPAPGTTTQTTTTTTTGSTSTTTTSTSSTPAAVVSSGTQVAISLGIDALGQFLVERTIDKELPQKVETMDQHVQALCEMLEKEIDLLQKQEQRDYNDIIDRETDFIRGNQLDPVARRAEIMKLPGFARQQREAQEKLTELKGAIARLALTHDALAKAAAGDNPESFTQKLGDLAPAGDSLGKLYTSLSATPSQ